MRRSTSGSPRAPGSEPPRPRGREGRRRAGIAAPTLCAWTAAAVGQPAEPPTDQAADQPPAPADGMGTGVLTPLAPLTPAPQAEPRPAIIVVNKERVIEASAPFAGLRRTEQEVRARVEAQLEKVKAELEAEELELTRLRATLPNEEFQRRTRDFDRRVREERRDAQERGAMLLRFLNEAQAALRSALPRVLEDLRRDLGAALVVDAGAVLAASDSADVTDEAIARFDAAMKGVTFDPPEELTAP
jgi:Skp family chaperone for outer membrane proteins